MKVKADFVTNSSTTSFVAWGISVEFSELRENSVLLQLMYLKYTDYMKQKGKDALSMDDWMQEIDSDMEFYSWFEYLLSVTGSKLESCRMPDDYSMGVGISPFNMNDNETFADFKNRVSLELHGFGLPSEAGCIEEAWRDG